MYLALGFVGWVLIGAVAGFVASRIHDSFAQQGVGKCLMVGVLGGVLGGFLLGMGVSKNTAGLLFTLFTSLMGAALLLFIVRLYADRHNADGL